MLEALDPCHCCALEEATPFSAIGYCNACEEATRAGAFCEHDMENVSAVMT